MECGKKLLGGASEEDLFPRTAELALLFPPSPCLEADVMAGAKAAILEHIGKVFYPVSEDV